MPETEQTYRIEIRFDFTGTESEARTRATVAAAGLGGEVTAIFDEDFEELDDSPATPAENTDSVKLAELPTPLSLADLSEHLHTHHDTDVHTTNQAELRGIHAEYHHNALTLVWDSPNAHTHPDVTPEPDPAPTSGTVSDCVVCHRWLDEVTPGVQPGICAECERGDDDTE